MWSRVMTRNRRSRIRGSSDDDGPILERLHALIANRTLPSKPPRKIYVGRAAYNHVCEVCGSPLRFGQVEYESDFENRVLYLHPRCFELWRGLDGASAVNAASRTVLVVDDRPDARYTMVRALAAAGFDVRQVASGCDALRVARQAIHLIVLDLVLPDMSGFDVLRRLKADPATKDIPVVIKTEFLSGDGIGQVALEAGAAAYFTDTDDPQALVHVVQQALRHASR